MKKEQGIHEKAIRLIEGGIVDVDGHSVKLVKSPEIVDSCYVCEMDCLCHFPNEMCMVCVECEEITQMGCFLTLMEQSSNRP